MTKNNSGLKAAILTMSFIQMATNAVSSILANIATEFPDASVTTIQYLMTFPNLMIVAVSVIAAGLADFICMGRNVGAWCWTGSSNGELSDLRLFPGK